MYTPLSNELLLNTAKQYQTPLYVYDGDRIRSQYQRLNSAFSGVPVKIKYALKACSNINVLKLLLSEGCGLDAVSINEVELGILAGCKAENILFTPSGARFEEIEQAVERGVQINIDSLPVIEKFLEKYGSTKSCCVRVNPSIRAGGNKNIQTGHSDSKFGVPLAMIDRVVGLVKNKGLKVSGLHVHTGSDIYDPEVFVQGVRTLCGLAKDFPDLVYLDFGGGFKVPYKEGDPQADVENLGSLLKSEYDEFVSSYGRKIDVYFEPGKFLVSESGYLLTEVTVVKETPNKTFVSVDSGLNHLIRPMMYGAYHHIENVSRPDAASKTVDVVGNICEEDTFASDRSIPDPLEGDLLSIRNAGAYGFSMSSNYNSRFRPAEVMIESGQARLIRERETLEDLLSKQVL